jgi:hypothetical protein
MSNFLDLRFGKSIARVHNIEGNSLVICPHSDRFKERQLLWYINMIARGRTPFSGRGNGYLIL